MTLTRPSLFASVDQRVEVQTPSERERYLDFLRVAAILMVIVGHWVVRVVVAPDDQPQAQYLLAEQPRWQWATLIWQVMPVIFLVGGKLNADSWRRARGDGVTSVGWIRRRARRLLRPAAALLLIVVPAWVLTENLFDEMLLINLGVALIPLWFIAAYLAVIALTPATLALHEQGWSMAAITLAIATATVTDLFRLAEIGPVLGTQPLVGLPNFLLIWVAIYQLGYLWADNRLPTSAAGSLALVVAGAAALAVLIGFADWPLAMVPVEGTQLPNNAAPPTVALFALALMQVGLVLLARKPVRRLLDRPWIWVPVALLGTRMLTLFLWHQLAMVTASNLAVQFDWLPLTDTIDARWWVQQPVWVIAFAVLLAGFIAAAGPLEQAGSKAEQTDSAGWTMTLSGIGLVAAGISGLLWLRMTDLPVGLAFSCLALLLAGIWALGAIGRHADN